MERQAAEGPAQIADIANGPCLVTGREAAYQCSLMTVLAPGQGSRRWYTRIAHAAMSPASWAP